MTSDDTIAAALRAYVDAGELAGVATLAWRRGRVEHVTTVGRRDVTIDLPVERDTLFRIASMTKPVTTVAALMLLDEGGFALDEPIARRAPELAQLRVLRRPGPLEETDAARRPIAFRDLLTHRAGDYLTFARIFIGGGEVDGVRLLRPETCAMMAANQLTAAQRQSAQLLGRPLFAEGHGYGMGVAVVTEPDMPELHQLERGIGLAAWMAIAQFHELSQKPASSVFAAEDGV